MKKYYLVGIKGTGMSALAMMLKDLGYVVVGSDVDECFGFEDGLYKKGISIFSFDEKNITNEYTYIIGNAYNQDNLEVRKIMDNKYKYYYYHEFISTLPGIHIAVSGTHGKTTTTKMIVDMLKGEKIAYIIGDGTGGAVKNYKYLIYEACEYQDHFLAYHPDVLVVNKVELDHPDYFNSIEDVYNSFNQLIKQSKNVITKDDNGFKKKSNVMTFGSIKASCPVKIIEENEKGFLVEIKDVEPIRIFLSVYGKHMVDNFICAYLVLRQLGYTTNFIKQKVDNINMPKRRMEEEKINKQIIVKDYAHHPTEIKAVYDSLSQKYPGIKMCVFFQPHTYTRTLALRSSFQMALDFFDEVYIFPTFTSKREKKDLVLQTEVDEVFRKYPQLKSLEKFVVEKEPKIYVFLGAGDIWQESKILYEKVMKINNEND